MNETIGNRILRYRKAKGLTQEELAELMGVSAQAVSKWENDISCPDVSLLPKLARVLGVTCDTLLTGSENDVMLLPENQRKSLDELVLHFNAISDDDDRIQVNLPLPLLQAFIELGFDTMPGMTGMDPEALKKVDFEKIFQLVQRGVIGKLVEITSADGGRLEVVVE